MRAGGGGRGGGAQTPANITMPICRLDMFSNVLVTCKGEYAAFDAPGSSNQIKQVVVPKVRGETARHENEYEEGGIAHCVESAPIHSIGTGGHLHWAKLSEGYPYTMEYG